MSFTLQGAHLVDADFGIGASGALDVPGLAHGPLQDQIGCRSTAATTRASNRILIEDAQPRRRGRDRASHRRRSISCAIPTARSRASPSTSAGQGRAQHAGHARRRPWRCATCRCAAATCRPPRTSWSIMLGIAGGPLSAGGLRPAHAGREPGARDRAERPDGGAAACAICCTTGRCSVGQGARELDRQEHVRGLGRARSCSRRICRPGCSMPACCRKAR